MSIQPRILVVDDQEIICEGCRRIFTSQGFAVETCTDSRTGLRMAEQNQYDAIVLDMKMPLLDGIRFLERLREVNLKIPVVVMSGRAGEAAQEAVSRFGAAEYLAKPFTPNEITAAVRRCLAGH